MFGLFNRDKAAALTELERLVRSKADEEVRLLVLGQMLALRDALAGHGDYETVPVRTADLRVRPVAVADLLKAMEEALLQVQGRTVYAKAMAEAVENAAKLAAGTLQPVQVDGVTGQLQANALSAEDAGVLHWVVQGLNKLGYSVAEARSVARQHVQPGMTLEQGIQACLKGRGRLN
jgi:hypothetical protein